MVKTILFDCWGTLIDDSMQPSAVRRVQTILGIEGDYYEFIAQFEQAFMLQNAVSIEEGFKEVCKTFNIEPTDEKIKELVDLWKHKTSISKPYDEVIEILEKLSKKYEMYLISNCDPFSLPEILEKYDLHKYFKGHFYSFEINILKTTPDFFEYVVKEINVPKEDIIVIGDSVRSEVENSEKVGLKCILIDRENKYNYQPKLPDLSGILSIL